MSKSSRVSKAVSDYISTRYPNDEILDVSPQLPELTAGRALASMFVGDLAKIGRGKYYLVLTSNRLLVTDISASSVQEYGWHAFQQITYKPPRVVHHQKGVRKVDAHVWIGGDQGRPRRLFTAPRSSRTALRRFLAEVSYFQADRFGRMMGQTARNKSLILLARLGRGQAASAAFAPDDATLAVGSAIGIHLHRTDTWDYKGFLPSASPITQIAFSPDGRFMAFAGQMIHVLDLLQGSTRIVSGHAGTITGLSFSQDGDRLASAGMDGTIQIWSTKSWHQLQIIEDDSIYMAFGVAFVEGDRAIAAVNTLGEQDVCTLRVWSVDSGKRKYDKRIGGTTYSNQAPTPVYGSTDGRLIATAYDKVFRIRRSRDCEEIHKLKEDQSRIQQLRFSSDGKFLASTNGSGMARLWDVRTGRLVRDFICKGQRNNVAISSDARLLATVGEKAQIWETSNGEKAYSLEGYTPPVLCARFCPGSKRTAVAYGDGLIRIWENTRISESLKLAGHSESVNSLAPDNRGRLFSASKDGVINLWDTESAQLVRSFEDRKEELRAIALAPDGTVLVSADEDKQLTIWDTRAGKQLKQLKAQDSVLDVEFVSDGSRLVSVDAKGNVQSWDMRDLSPMNRVFQQEQPIIDLSFLRSEQLLVTVGIFGEILVYNLEHNDVYAKFALSNTLTASSAISPDGRSLIVGDAYGFLHLWDLQSRRYVDTIAAHTAAVSTLDFSHNDKLLLSGSLDGTVLIWTAV